MRGSGRYPRRQFLLGSLVCGAAGLIGAKLVWQPHGLQRFERSTAALGTQVKITALSPDKDVADAAIEAAFAELADVEAHLSIYRAASEVSWLNYGKPLPNPSRHLQHVLAMAADISAASGGAFDITVQPLWRTYDAARREGRLPSAEEIAAAKRCIDWRRVECGAQHAQLRGSGTQVTLNGIAQGYAADRVLAVLREHGIEQALIDAGELAPLGAREDGQPWQTGIQHPREADAFVALAKLAGRCLASSGDYASTFTADRRYHHLLDPRTGSSPDELASVSIAAPTAMEADALSTACFVLGAERAAELLAARSNVDAFFVTKSGRTLHTPGFPVEA